MPRGGHLNPIWKPDYDRITSTYRLSYWASNVAPHGNTVRISQTVPASSTARIAAATCGILRTAAAAPAGLVLAYVGHSNGVNNQPWLHATCLDATVGVRDEQNVGTGAIYQTTTLIEAATQDASTGGTMDYRLGLNAILYSS